jgi:signal transduction histidine kinase
VLLTSSDRELTVTVVDDGCGIAEGARAGTGLRSMRERADELGGTCTVSADTGGGTRVTAMLPVHEGEA